MFKLHPFFLRVIIYLFLGNDHPLVFFFPQIKQQKMGCFQFLYLQLLELYTSEEQKLLCHFTDLPSGSVCVGGLQAATSLLPVPVLYDGCGNSPISHLWLQTPLEWCASRVPAGSSRSCTDGVSSYSLLICYNRIQFLHIKTAFAFHKSIFVSQCILFLEYEEHASSAIAPEDSLFLQVALFPLPAISSVCPCPFAQSISVTFWD